MSRETRESKTADRAKKRVKGITDNLTRVDGCLQSLSDMENDSGFHSDTLTLVRIGDIRSNLYLIRSFLEEKLRELGD